jgi:plasmid rolling circle replication initiator protein Rep
MVLNLLDAASKTGVKNEDIYRGYWNTYHCQNKVYTANGRIYGKYCKNRCCTLCCSIRKAEIINKYLPVLQQWEDPYFVTLTVKSVSKKSLHKFISGVLRALNLITAKYRKRNQRGDPIRLIGLKSLECNFNPTKKTYNPHLHLIVPGKQIAEILIKEWLQKWTIKFASPKGQKASPIYNKEKALIEIINMEVRYLPNLM